MDWHLGEWHVFLFFKNLYIFTRQEPGHAPWPSLPFCNWWNWDVGNFSVSRKWWIQNLNLNYVKSFCFFHSTLCFIRWLPGLDEFLMIHIRKLQDNRLLLTEGDFLDHSYIPPYWFSLSCFHFPCHCPCWTEGLPPCLVCRPHSSTILAFEFDLLISTCLNDKIEKAFTK